MYDLCICAWVQNVDSVHVRVDVEGPARAGKMGQRRGLGPVSSSCQHLRLTWLRWSLLDAHRRAGGLTTGQWPKWWRREWTDCNPHASTKAHMNENKSNYFLKQNGKTTYTETGRHGGLTSIEFNLEENECADRLRQLTTIVGASDKDQPTW